MSMRRNGANLPRIVTEFLGKGYAAVFSWMMVILLLLVVAVFINVPANLVDKTWLTGGEYFWTVVGVIFAYYVAATLFPVDKIIGRIYPVFGGLLILGSLALAVALVAAGFAKPEILDDCAGFASFRETSPLFPCLFVTIACGIISGFHATQSPIVARTVTSEREARATFFGMMILEGVIAMVWAAAALAIYNLAPENLKLGGATVLGNIATHFLGTWVGGVTVAAVVILAVTSGDTALRSARLSLGEMCRVNQVPIVRRILTCLPLGLAVAGLLAWSNESPKSFNNLWNYFAWGNQLIAVTTLFAGTVWLLREKKGAKALVALLPGVFMSMVVTTFIFWAWPTKGQVWGVVPGGLPMPAAVTVGAVLTALAVVFVIRRGRGGRE